MSEKDAPPKCDIKWEKTKDGWKLALDCHSEEDVARSSIYVTREGVTVRNVKVEEE